jgi:hypothetical protein
MSLPFVDKKRSLAARNNLLERDYNTKTFFDFEDLRLIGHRNLTDFADMMDAPSPPKLFTNTLPRETFENKILAAIDGDKNGYTMDDE